MVSYQYNIYPTTVPYSYSCGKVKAVECSVKHDIIFVMPNGAI